MAKTTRRRSSDKPTDIDEPTTVVATEVEQTPAAETPAPVQRKEERKEGNGGG